MTGDRTQHPLALYFFSHFLVGMSAAALGPTLPGLANQMGSTLQAVSVLFAVRALANLTGTILSGYAYDRLAGHLVLAGAFVALAGATAVTSSLGQFIAIILSFMVMGLAEGLINVGGNTLTLWSNRHHLNASVTTLHFFYSVGGFIAPLLVALVIGLTDSAVNIYRLLPWMLLAPLPLLVLRRGPVPVHHTPDGSQPTATPWRYLLAMLAMIAVFVGVESSISGWVYTYAIGTSIATETSAAYLTSMYWAMLSVGRLLAIPVARRFSPHRILSVALGGMLVSALVVTVGGSYGVVVVGIMGLGLCMAPVFPTMFVLAGETMPMTGRMTSGFFVSGSVGAMLLPWLIGVAVGWLGASVIMWAITGGIVIILIAYRASHRLSQQMVSSSQVKARSHA